MKSKTLELRGTPVQDIFRLGIKEENERIKEDSLLGKFKTEGEIMRD